MVELLGAISASPRCLPITTAWRPALTTLKDNGIVVPQHLSLIGFDDIPISRYTDPQLTTVRYPVMSMAKLATELALLGRPASWIARQRTALCRRWCAVIPLPSGKLWGRSLTDAIAGCNRFQFVSHSILTFA